MTNELSTCLVQLHIAIHKDNEGVYGVIIPDVPGCHSWGETIEHAAENAKDAVYSHLETLAELGEPFNIKPSPIASLQQNKDFDNAVWSVVSIDLSRFNAVRIFLK